MRFDFLAICETKNIEREIALRFYSVFIKNRFLALPASTVRPFCVAESENTKFDSVFANGFDVLSISSFSSAIHEFGEIFNELFDIGCKRALTACKILC